MSCLNKTVFTNKKSNLAFVSSSAPARRSEQGGELQHRGSDAVVKLNLRPGKLFVRVLFFFNSTHLVIVNTSTNTSTDQNVGG